MSINDLLLQYAKANIELHGIYHLTVPPKRKVLAQTTMPGVCGLLFPIRGKARFTLCKETYLLEPGVILHAGSAMELDKEVVGTESWEYMLLHYKVANEEEGAQSLLKTHFLLKIFQDQSREMMQILQRLEELAEKTDERSLLSKKMLIYRLLSVLMDLADMRLDLTPRDPMDEVINYIHENLDKNLAVSELAESFSCNKKQFSYQFQKRVGIAPKKYIMKVQMNRAKELLSDSQISIIEVANRIGYEDSLHFSRIFKQNFGTSPSIYRRQLGKNPY
jgi:AraC-like DNA-binding protein